MKKTYKSKIHKAVLLPLALLLTIAAVILLVNEIWAGALLTAVAVGFLFYFYRKAGYELTGDNKLHIRNGLLSHKEIYVTSIKTIRQRRSAMASPRLLDQIEISYNRYDRVLVSPNQPTEFISELRQANPRITVDEPSGR